MEVKLVLKMVKRISKGYTFASTILVLTVLSILSLWSLTRFWESYEMYALRHSVELAELAIQRAKYQSYLLAKKIDLCFYSNSIVVGDLEYALPRGVSTEEDVCLYYNVRGNVSLANTITFVGEKHRISVVIQIGGGYYEIREIEAF